MTDSKNQEAKHQDSKTETHPQDQAQHQAPSEQAAPEAAAPSAPEQAAPDATTALQAEVDGLKDKLLRTLADMENLRRRTEKEVADARTYATTSFARDMLTVTDNLRRAIDSVPAEAREQADATLKPILEGVELTERDLLKTLERHGIRKVEPLNERFDPNLHQAMFEAENPAVAAGTVTQVVQAGFVIGERVLRPALVGVAKGGPKAS
jgi:molecular chaperone GrpE